MRNGGNIEVGGYNSGNDKGIILTPADSSSYWHIYNDAGGELVFGRNITIGSSEHMRIDQAGLVGIGTTSPNNKLDVIGNVLIQGTTGFNASNEIANLYLGDTNSVIRAEYDVGTHIMTNDTKRLTVRGSTGNVGIGTSSPSATLDVTSTAQNVLDLETTNSDGPLFTFINNGTVRGYIGNAEGAMGLGTSNFAIRAQGELVIGTNGNNERMRIGTSGQIGIGGANYGTDGQILTSTGASSAPAWEDAPASGPSKGLAIAFSLIF